MRGRNGGGGNNNNNNNNNNNRRGPNPLNRNYESNGPDVKIRGSAQQIAEKYATLARDAQSSGDRVIAENYLQHAEHYNRIIAAAQAQMPIQHVQQNRDDFDDDMDEDREDFENGAANAEVQVPAVNHGAGPQPEIEGTPAEVALNAERGRDSRDGGNRHNRDRRHGGYGPNGQRNDQGQRGEQFERRETAQGEQDGKREGVQAQPENVADAEQEKPQVGNFNPASIAAEADRNGADQNGADQSGADQAEAPRRARRPRRPRAGQQEAGAEGGEAASADAGETAAAES
jgi:hypothetical protein